MLEIKNSKKTTVREEKYDGGFNGAGEMVSIKNLRTKQNLCHAHMNSEPVEYNGNKYHIT